MCLPIDSVKKVSISSAAVYIKDERFDSRICLPHSHTFQLWGMILPTKIERNIAQAKKSLSEYLTPTTSFFFTAIKYDWLARNVCPVRLIERKDRQLTSLEVPESVSYTPLFSVLSNLWPSIIYLTWENILSRFLSHDWHLEISLVIYFLIHILFKPKQKKILGVIYCWRCNYNRSNDFVKATKTYFSWSNQYNVDIFLDAKVLWKNFNMKFWKNWYDI